MTELIWNYCLRAFVFRKLINITTHPVIYADLHGAGRKKFLKTRLVNMTCGETMIGNESRSFGIGNRKIGIL